MYWDVCATARARATQTAVYKEPPAAAMWMKKLHHTDTRWFLSVLISFLGYILICSRLHLCWKFCIASCAYSDGLKKNYSRIFVSFSTSIPQSRALLKGLATHIGTKERFRVFIPALKELFFGG